jgi:hypothetical protein
MWPGQPFDKARTNQFPVHIQIWMATTDGKLERISKPLKRAVMELMSSKKLLGLTQSPRQRNSSLRVLSLTVSCESRGSPRTIYL